MDSHRREYILNRLAPCGIHCGKCFAYADGTIRRSSVELKEALGNFDIYAQRFAELLEEPVFKKYVDFKELLAYFAAAQCNGCRNEACKLFKSCKVRDCHKEKGVDFCFQCPEFPCDNTGFDEHLYKRSVEINRRIEEVGFEKYYEEIKNKPRY
ncbi:MAG TPA: DUF3795 domain-containing protein [Williamwhitmania sp.]|nr:DUF3795 domain-containing protein [Williamwhitmania sp.]